jgi:hypothetical protein
MAAWSMTQTAAWTPPRDAAIVVVSRMFRTLIPQRTAASGRDAPRLQPLLLLLLLLLLADDTAPRSSSPPPCQERRGTMTHPPCQARRGAAAHPALLLVPQQ